MKNYYIIFILLSYFTVYSQTEQISYRWRNDDGGETGATWKAEKDTSIEISDTSKLRLRIQTYNRSLQKNSRFINLQYSTSTSGPWVDITNEVGSNHFVYENSSFIDEDDFVTSQLTFRSFRASGYSKIIESYNTNLYELDPQSYHEVEYVIKPTSNILSSTTYYFKGGSNHNSYFFSNFTQAETSSTLSTKNLTKDDFIIKKIDNNIILKNAYVLVEKVSIHNTAGQSLIVNKGNSISIKNLNTGVYLLRIQTSKGIVTKKIMI
jgi:hypothetical protein